jgi:hypothetical protein
MNVSLSKIIGDRIMEPIIRLIDSLSLSGSIIAMLFGLTFIGVMQNNEKVYSMFGSAFTSFIAGRTLASKLKPLEAAKDPEPQVLKEG